MSFQVINYKFIAASAITASKAVIYRIEPGRISSEPHSVAVDRQSVSGDNSVGVHPVSYLGRYFNTDLSLGLTESADGIKITDAVCSVSKAKHIIKTSLIGLSGTIKEYICDGDFDMTIVVGIVAVENDVVVDKYPEDGVRDLSFFLDQTDALYVDSDFLRLFDITRLVITDYSIRQMTDSNRQEVTIRAVSDDDYTIKHNEY